MLRGGKIKLVAIVSAIILLSSVSALAALQTQQKENKESSALPIVPLGEPVPAALELNGTFPDGRSIWKVVIGETSDKHPISSYQAVLMNNGKVLVGPETLHEHGLLGRKGDISFHFFEGTPNGSCRRGPCDGMLSHGDYLKLDLVEPGETYLVRILWGATGETLTEVTVNN